MKKFILSLFLVFSVLFAPSQFASAQTANPNPALAAMGCVNLTFNMKQGSTNAITAGQVSVLQKFLFVTGHLTVNPTGFFGPLTHQAVMSFQTANGLVPDGAVGPLTRAKIAQITGCANAGVNSGANSGGTTSGNAGGGVNNPPTSPTLTGSNIILPPGCNSVTGFNTINGLPCKSLITNPTPSTTPTNPTPTPTNPNPNPNPATPVVVACNSTATTPTPTVTVGYPNGGEKLVLGQQLTILWKSCDLPANAEVSIDLMYQTNATSGTFAFYNLIKHTANDGTETIALSQPVGMPDSYISTANFKLRISTVYLTGAAGPFASDVSDNLFGITQ